MRLLIVLLSVAVVQLWAAPVEKGTKRGFEGLHEQIIEYLHTHPTTKYLPDGIHIDLPILPKRAISLADFMLHNPLPNVFDPDRKRQADKRNVFLPLTPIEEFLQSHPGFINMVGKKSTADKRNVFLPLTPIEEFLQSHPGFLNMVGKKSTADKKNVFLPLTPIQELLQKYPDFVNTFGRRSTSDKRFVILTPEMIQSLILNNPSIMAVTGRSAEENLLDKRVFWDPTFIQQYIHDHPVLANINNLVRSTENMADKRFMFGSIVDYVQQHPEVLWLSGRESSENADKRNIFGSIVNYVQQHPEILWLSGRESSENFEKRNITLSPDWMSHVILPGGMSLELYNQLINFGK